MMPHFRLLPVTIFVALLMFMVRANDIWRGFMSIEVTSSAMAQAGTQQPPSNNPGTQQLPAKKASPQPEKPDQVAEKTSAAKKPADKAPADADGGSFTQSEVELLQKLSERREGLEQRGRELDMREGLLKAAEQRIDKKVGELKTLQTSIDALLKKHNEQEEAKMSSLVKIYENMKPKDAARIFEQLDMPVLLDVVERMSERKIAPIMAEMAPTKAKAVTAELAQRRQMPQPSASDG